MSSRLIKRGRQMMAVSGLGLAFIATTGFAAEIGPLPALKSDLLKAEIFVRLFLPNEKILD